MTLLPYHCGCCWRVSCRVKEDNDGTKDQAGIECSGRDIVILLEPAEILSPDIILENEANHTPAEVVIGGCGRGGAETAKHD
jgi:hypothetical protein